MCHPDDPWTELLPTILLGLRTYSEEDLKASSAEISYGTSLRLRLPNGYFTNEDMSADSQISI